VRVKVRYRDDAMTGERVPLLSERPGRFMAGLSLGDTCDRVDLTPIRAIGRRSFGTSAGLAVLLQLSPRELGAGGS
jgi:hypothetical protein